MDTTETDQLLASVALGDRDAFSRLYELTSAKLLGICLAILKDRAAAEDVLQEVFLKIWQRAGQYQANDLGPLPWLATIARNTAIDHYRAQRGEVMLRDVEEFVPTAVLTPEEATLAHAEADRLLACLSELNAKPRDAVIGAYLRGETYKDLAARLNAPLNTVRTWLRRSLISLRECMSDDS